jgi:uncharacterized protein (TIGR04141 family)
MASELGKISIYLAKDGKTFDDVIDKSKITDEGDNFKVRCFEVSGCQVMFYCRHTVTKKTENPPWLEFVNEKLSADNQKIHFDTYSKRPNGLLLMDIDGHILAASFGIGATSLLRKHQFFDDFGIKAAMNMCGNKELRQTKSSTHAITTQNIDRQLSKPSDSFSFGLNETEFLQYISAHIENEKKVTLQGKDSLTLKVIGDEKLSWDKLIDYGKKFINEYSSDKYKELFPNYPNLQNIEKEKSDELDLKLIEKLKNEEHDKIHLAIPEFLSDDEFSFSYTNFEKKENIIYSHIDISQIKSIKALNFGNLTLENLNKVNVYAFCHDQDQVLGYRKWDLYRCIISEIEWNGEYFVLSNGTWRKVDNEFYRVITDFVDNAIEEEDIPEAYKNIEISDRARSQNREEIFNKQYCELNANAIKFDQEKLRIGQSSKDKEFCDILEYSKDGSVAIIHVKKHGGADAMNYLFSQARFYCEFFLGDKVFLDEIRDHVNNSEKAIKHNLLQHIKETQCEVVGKDYTVKLWLLYDNKSPPPQKSDLPLMAKYDLKLTYERLRNFLKFSEVKLSMVPVQTINFTISKRKKEKSR